MSEPTFAGHRYRIVGRRNRNALLADLQVELRPSDSRLDPRYAVACALAVHVAITQGR